jgi:hypothetical protein
MALAVGFAVAAVLGVSDALPSDILVALRPMERLTQEDQSIIIDNPPTGVARGIQLGLLGLLFGGVPAAILATALAARRRNRERGWSGDWGKVFFAGFVFQLSSLVFTAFLLLVLLWAAYDSEAQAKEVVSFGGPLLLSVVCGIWGLRSWRALQLDVQTPATITPYQRPG